MPPDPTLRSMKRPLLLNTFNSGKKKSPCTCHRAHSSHGWYFPKLSWVRITLAPRLSVALLFSMLLHTRSHLVCPCNPMASNPHFKQVWLPLPAHFLVTGSHTWQDSSCFSAEPAGCCPPPGRAALNLLHGPSSSLSFSMSLPLISFPSWGTQPAAALG